MAVRIMADLGVHYYYLQTNGADGGDGGAEAPAIKAEGVEARGGDGESTADGGGGVKSEPMAPSATTGAGGPAAAAPKAEPSTPSTPATTAADASNANGTAGVPPLATSSTDALVTAALNHSMLSATPLASASTMALLSNSLGATPTNSVLAAMLSANGSAAATPTPGGALAGMSAPGTPGPGPGAVGAKQEPGTPATAALRVAGQPGQGQQVVDPAVQRQQREAFLVRQLTLLLHGLKCPQLAGCAPACTQIKTLMAHMRECQQAACPMVMCAQSKRLLQHYNQCSDKACSVCTTVRENEAQRRSKLMVCFSENVMRFGMAGWLRIGNRVHHGWHLTLASCCLPVRRNRSLWRQPPWTNLVCDLMVFATNTPSACLPLHVRGVAKDVLSILRSTAPPWR